MYLKQIQIKGFKSFADHTEIWLEPGLNIIVGPNGCGKSNIVDALRWVLGEGNVRNLRGQRSEDVIFCGTDQKKPLGYAAVSLLIDNQDRGMDLDFSEITVTRKVYRDGESEFYLNRNPVRMKDIHELFSGTGLGKRGYTVIAQGELEQVLNAKPFERRLILEEACGLSVYRRKKEEAQARLKTTLQDLVRVKDVLEGLKERLEELEVKARKAKKFLAWQDKLREVEEKILAARLLYLDKELREKKRALAEVGEEIALLSSQIADKRKVWAEIKTDMDRLAERTLKLRELKFSQEAELNRLLGEIQLLSERAKNASEQADRIEDDCAKYQEMLVKIEEDLRLSRDNLREKERMLGSRRKEAAENEAKLREAEERLKEESAALEALKNEVVDGKQKEVSLRNRLGEEEEKVAKLKERLTKGQNESSLLKDRLELVNGTLETLSKEKDVLLLELREWEGRSERKKEELDGLRKELEKLKGAREEALLLVRQIRKDIAEINKDIETRFGYSEAVRSLFAACKAKPNLVPGLVGLVADLIEVPNGLETAVEAGAGRGLENVVVKEEEDARKAIELLKAKRWGRLSFLPLSLLRPTLVDEKLVAELEAMPGVVGLASRLIDFDPQYRSAINYVFGRLLVVEDLKVGLKVFQKRVPFRIVTLEGDIINASGVMTGGYTRDKASGPLMKKRELAERRRKLEMVEEEVERIEGELGEKEQRLAYEETCLSEARDRKNELSFRFQLLNKEIEKNEKEKARLKEELKKTDIVLKMAEKEVVEWEHKVGVSREKLSCLVMENEQRAQRLEEARKRQDEIAREYEILRERCQHSREFLQSQEGEINEQKRSLKQLESVKASYLRAYEEGLRQIDNLKESTRQIESKKSQCSRELEDKAREIATLKEELESCEKSWKQGQEAQALLEQEMEPLIKRLQELQDHTRSLELKKVRLETEYGAAYSEWKEKGRQELTPLPKWDGKMERLCKRQLDVLSKALDRLGPVDPGVIREFEEVQERFQFLSAQFQDLTKAQEDLTRLIKETENMIDRRFREFLIEANTSFKQTFVSIFQGGDARLVQIEGGEEEGQGVEILVKMPGKRQQALNLLSGGERALTCIAFIFSLLALKPAPFCVLDEIDAALDDVNLNRFTRYLVDLSRKMQFIVITHRQGTIACGQTIYGVTMPERGVSKVLSLSLDEAEALAG